MKKDNGFQIIRVTKSVKLSIKNKQLSFCTLEETLSFPLEDINTIIIENNIGSISFQLISKLIQGNINLIICDQKHLPIGQILSFGSN